MALKYSFQRVNLPSEAPISFTILKVYIFLMLICVILGLYSCPCLKEEVAFSHGEAKDHGGNDSPCHQWHQARQTFLTLHQGKHKQETIRTHIPINTMESWTTTKFLIRRSTWILYCFHGKHWCFNYYCLICRRGELECMTSNYKT